jgi:hypothetical protein
MKPGTPKQPPAPVIKDYLHETRQPHKANASLQHLNWKEELGHLNSSLDEHTFVSRTRRLELLAEMKEQALSGKANLTDVRKADEVNDILIGSVRAKLALLSSGAP